MCAWKYFLQRWKITSDKVNNVKHFLMGYKVCRLLGWRNADFNMPVNKLLKHFVKRQAGYLSRCWPLGLSSLWLCATLLLFCTQCCHLQDPSRWKMVIQLISWKGVHASSPTPNKLKTNLTQRVKHSLIQAGDTHRTLRNGCLCQVRHLVQSIMYASSITYSKSYSTLEVAEDLLT